MIKLNSHFESFFKDTNRYLVSSGGAGAGKSVAAAQKILLRCVNETNPLSPHTFLIIRKAYAINQVSTYQELCKIIRNEPSLNKICHIKLSPLEIRFNNGNKIIFGGLNDDSEIEKIKSISSITGIWIEEANQITEDGFKQLDLRLRGQTDFYKQIILTFNPVTTFNWIYKYFFAQPIDYIQDNTTKYHSTYLNNDLIDKAYKNVLESYKNEDENYYRIYCLGEWGSIDSTVYKPFTILDKFPNELEDKFKYDETIYGIDFGFNHPSVLLRINIKDDNYYIEELIYESGMTRTQFFDKIETYITNKNDYIYCDSAEPESILEMKQRGLNALASNKAVKDGINYIQSIASKIFTKADNINFNRENVTYMWKTKNNKDTDDVVKINDDAMDAMRYALFTHKKIYHEVSFSWTRASNIFGR